jgi:hypothetical protein
VRDIKGSPSQGQRPSSTLTILEYEQANNNLSIRFLFLWRTEEPLTAIIGGTQFESYGFPVHTLALPPALQIRVAEVDYWSVWFETLSHHDEK